MLIHISLLIATLVTFNLSASCRWYFQFALIFRRTPRQLFFRVSTVFMVLLCF